MRERMYQVLLCENLNPEHFFPLREVQKVQRTHPELLQLYPKVLGKHPLQERMV